MDKLPPKHDIQYAIESDSEEVIYQGDEEACDNSDDDHEREDISHNCTKQTTSIHLLVISTAFSQLEEKNDGKGTSIFHTFTKIWNQDCKVIVARESCINAVFSELIEKDGLKMLPHFHPFKVS